MIVIVDDRDLVKDGYTSWFDREGVCAAGFAPAEFGSWVETVADPDIRAVEAFLLGHCNNRSNLPGTIRRRSGAAVIAMNDNKSLDDTLELFAAGVDDVVGKPVHVRELLARIEAIRRRCSDDGGVLAAGRIRVFGDGRDPVVGEDVMLLPRRERRILEYLVSNKGRRVTKAQIFSSVYGLFDQDIDDSVIECHMSRLRKRLRERLGEDPVTSKRHLGYMLADI